MTPPGPSERIVIDPDDLRRVATRMREAAEVLSSAGRQLATRSMPAMPVGLETHVADVVQTANRRLQELALEFVQTAGELSARATQAELGGIDSVAWLVPSLHGLLSSSAPHGGTLSSSGTLLGGQPRRSGQWAEIALEAMDSPAERSDDVGLDLRDFVEHLVESSGGPGDMPPTGATLDLYLQNVSGAQPETGTARGALEIAFDESELGPTGIGLIGCLISGSAGGPVDATLPDK